MTAIHINLFPLYDLLISLKDSHREIIIPSLIEHTISDLGYSIVLNSSDIRETIIEQFPEITHAISELIHCKLLTISTEKLINIEKITPFNYILTIA